MHTAVILASTYLLAAPASLAVLLGLAALTGRTVPERTVGRLVRWVFVSAFVAAIGLSAILFAVDLGTYRVKLFDWFSVAGYTFEMTLLVDALSVSFSLAIVALCGVVGSFANRYMHREPGFQRFFMLMTGFAAGMMALALAGNIEVALAGWEIAGLASALLIGFFHEREAAVSSGYAAFVVYRVCDMGMLAAAVLLHHAAGRGDLSVLFGSSPWPGGTAPIAVPQATAIALLLAFAAAGKSAQLPFSTWLPRAMEGPTPSSAIFYGALSVHAGAYLLLRVSPLLDRAPVAAATVAVLGAATALHAVLVSRVQSDIKCALAYASLAQVGLIFMEIGLGFRWLPLIHLTVHAFLRAMQFLRAPSLLHDLHAAEESVGEHLPRLSPRLGGLLSERAAVRLYHVSLERFHLDTWLYGTFVAPLMRLLGRADRAERWLVARVARGVGG